MQTKSSLQTNNHYKTEFWKTIQIGQNPLKLCLIHLINPFKVIQVALGTYQWKKGDC